MTETAISDVLGKKRIVRLTRGKYATWSRGKGPLVILLHGWPVTSYHWRFLVPALVAAGFECLSIDLKGLGESSTTDDRYQKKTIGREILQVVSALRTKESRFALLGHDWGGSIAIAIAAMETDRVSSLIIEDEIAPGVEAPLQGESRRRYPTWHGGFHRSVTLAEDLIRGKEEQYINYFLDLRFKSSSLLPKDRRHYLGHYRSAKKTAVALAYYRTYRSDAAFFRRLLKTKLDMPTLAIGGAYGMGSSVKDSLVRIARRVAGVSMDTSGHYPAEEEPRKFNKTVLNFLRENHSTQV